MFPELNIGRVWSTKERGEMDTLLLSLLSFFYFLRDCFYLHWKDSTPHDTEQHVHLFYPCVAVLMLQYKVGWYYVKIMWISHG